MEGSRHEKAVLTAVAYIIGFTAAYILFGNFNSQTAGSTPAFISSQTGNVASVAAALPISEEVEDVAVEFAVAYREGELQVVTKQGVQVLSVNPDTTGVDIAGLTQGYHYGDIHYIVSEDKKFVFFCEQQDVDSDTCFGYVFDVDANKIYPISKGGVAVRISDASARDTIFTTLGLKIGSNYSANPKAPWVLISGE